MMKYLYETFLSHLYEAPTYKGAIEHPDVSYDIDVVSNQITKVTANLANYHSGRYTKLGRNLLRIERIEKAIKKLKDETKAETKELIQDLFLAEDTARTRVVETVGFTFHLTKDPDPSKTVAYAKVLKELEDHLTPELIAVLETIKDKYTTETQKSAALKTTDKSKPEEPKKRKTKESINEGFIDNIKAYFAKFKSVITSWASRYDKKLDHLKAMVDMNESLNEDFSFTHDTKRKALNKANEIMNRFIRWFDKKDFDRVANNDIDKAVSHIQDHVAMRVSNDFDIAIEDDVYNFIKHNEPLRKMIHYALDRKLN